MIKKLLLPLVPFFIVVLSKSIVDDAAVNIDLNGALLVAFGMLLAAFIALTLKTLKDLFISLGTYFQEKEPLDDNLISDYAITGKQQ